MKSRHNKKGFTLVELVVIMAVISVLVLLAVPKLNGHTERAKLTELKSNTKQLENASERYYIDNQDWPRLSDKPYTKEQIESFAQEIKDRTGHVVVLDPEGDYYDIDYEKLQKYVQKPKDNMHYILQNPVGEVYYLDELTHQGVARIKSEDSEPVMPEIKGDILQITPGGYHTLAIKKDGTLWGWGPNQYGQLGLGDNIARTNPVKIPGMTNIKKVMATVFTTIVLKNDGTVWTSGYNNTGQLGLGHRSDIYTFSQIPNFDNVIDIATSNHSITAMKSDGTLWSWGYNNNGQLGINNGESFKTIPTLVPDFNGVKKIYGGGGNMYALKEDGTVWGWGSNIYGNLGLGDQNNYRYKPTQLTTLSNVKELAVGGNFALALKEDGTLWSWGYNTKGELGYQYSSYVPKQVPNITDIKAIAAGDYTTLILKNDGTLWICGTNSGINPLTQLTELINIIEVKMYYNQYTVRTEDGKVFTYKQPKTLEREVILSE